MYHIVFAIIFSFIFSQSIQSASQEVSTIAAQPYTAQQHFQEIKELLLATKYTSPQDINETARIDKNIS